MLDDFAMHITVLVGVLNVASEKQVMRTKLRELEQTIVGNVLNLCLTHMNIFPSCFYC